MGPFGAWYDLVIASTTLVLLSFQIFNEWSMLDYKKKINDTLKFQKLKSNSWGISKNWTRKVKFSLPIWTWSHRERSPHLRLRLCGLLDLQIPPRCNTSLCSSWKRSEMNIIKGLNKRMNVWTYSLMSWSFEPERRRFGSIGWNFRSLMQWPCPINVPVHLNWWAFKIRIMPRSPAVARMASPVTVS